MEDDVRAVQDLIELGPDPPRLALGEEVAPGRVRRLPFQDLGLLAAPGPRVGAAAVAGVVGVGRPPRLRSERLPRVGGAPDPRPGRPRALAGLRGPALLAREVRGPRGTFVEIS